MAGLNQTSNGSKYAIRLKLTSSWRRSRLGSFDSQITLLAKVHKH